MQNYNKFFEQLMQINSYNYKIISYEKLFNKIFSELYIHHIKKSKIYKDILEDFPDAELIDVDLNEKENKSD